MPASEAWVAIGVVSTAVTGLLGKLGLSRKRNGNGVVLSPSSKAIVTAIETAETSNERRYAETKEVDRDRHKAMMTKMGEVAAGITDVRERQIASIAHREGREAERLARGG